MRPVRKNTDPLHTLSHRTNETLLGFIMVCVAGKFENIHPFVAYKTHVGHGMNKGLRVFDRSLFHQIGPELAGKIELGLLGISSLHPYRRNRGRHCTYACLSPRALHHLVPRQANGARTGVGGAACLLSGRRSPVHEFTCQTSIASEQINDRVPSGKLKSRRCVLGAIDEIREKQSTCNFSYR
jgi:hypothetical protein